MFKVWDRVRIKKWTDWNPCWEMDWLIWVEATIESIGCRSSYWDWNLYNLKDFSKEWITNWDYNSTMLELVEPQKMVVHCPTKAEANQLMQAYERKGWVWVSWDNPTKWNNWKHHKEDTCYIFEDKFGYWRKERYLDRWYKVITFQEAMELLGEKVENKPHAISNFKYTIDDEPGIPLVRRRIMAFGSPENIEQKTKQTSDSIDAIKYTFHHWDKPFNPLIKNPMNTLRENIRNNFFKKEENKLATLVETVEEKAEAVEELKWDLWNLIDMITETVDILENAVEIRNKKAIKEYKKQLQELEKKLDDTLMKQLIVVWKKVFKE